MWIMIILLMVADIMLVYSMRKIASIADAQSERRVMEHRDNKS